MVTVVPSWMSASAFAPMCVAIMRAEAARDPHDRYEELTITAEPGLVLMIYTAEPGSPSAERLRLLSSWAAEPAALDRSRAQ